MGAVHSGGFAQVILILEKQRQEDCCKFKATVVNTVNPESASGTKEPTMHITEQNRCSVHSVPVKHLTNAQPHAVGPLQVRPA